LAVLRLPVAELPSDVDPLKREDFLSDEDFLACFGDGSVVSGGAGVAEARGKLAKMPAWKRGNLKKKHGLF
jgi:hypothetical protein